MPKKMPNCPFCGEPFRVTIEDECGQHPNEKWFFVDHSCTVDIEVFQKGGTISEIAEKLKPRWGGE